jgi:hypothetical protein
MIGGMDTGPSFAAVFRTVAFVFASLLLLGLACFTVYAFFNRPVETFYVCIGVLFFPLLFAAWELVRRLIVR